MISSKVLFSWLVLASAVLAGCVNTPSEPAGEPLSPAASSPAPTLLPAAPRTGPPAPYTIIPGLVATPTPAPAATPTAVSTAAPRPSPIDRPAVTPTTPPPYYFQTPRVLEPTDPQLFAVAQSPKLGGALATFLMYRSYAPENDHLEIMKDAMKAIEGLGGVLSVVQFSRVLSDSEIDRIEKQYGIVFGRQDGKVQNWSRVYSVVIPVDKFAAVLALPDIEQIDSFIL